jgi:Uma2 family endonuclease
MARAFETVAQRRFTVEEYHRMAETGILSPDERLELLWGVVCPMSPKNRAHVIAANRVADLFRQKLAGRARVYKEDPLPVVSLDSEPEPDIMVCGNPDLEAFGTARMEPLLTIEIADSSLHRDLGNKVSLYAMAGVPEYWVLNLVDRELEVFRDPGEGRYRSHFRARPTDRVSPEPWPDVEIEVSALFPDE